MTHDLDGPAAQFLQPRTGDATPHRADGKSILPGAWFGPAMWVALGIALGAWPTSCPASTAYGSLNNFDVVNDTGTPCHGFEIELEDLESHDITHTYDWNHYGTPGIREDSASVPGRTNVIVRYASPKNPDGTWASYTAVPAGPIAPTDGHQFTDPSVNFGGEHFGVGYQRTPTGVKYFWLVDDGHGVLVRGPAVNLATPVFSYQAPAAGRPAQVQAVIEPPEPPEIPVVEFGPASWVKEIRTTSHNDREVKLRDLVSDDPDLPDDRNWRNGEPDEVEVEWQLLQEEFNKPDGGEHGKLAGAPEDLPDGDEVITRRYEFYKYVGPLDAESGEAKASKVGADGVHGEGLKEINGVEVDLATVEVVGEYIGAQMSALDVDLPVGLVEHLQDGEAGTPYPSRKVVIGGARPFTASVAGALPASMTFDPVTGVVSGTPTEAGTFSVTIRARDDATPEVTKTYSLRIAPPGVGLPPRCVVETGSTPAEGGTTTGAGSYDHGTVATVEARPNPGFLFAEWTENGRVASQSAAYQFTSQVHRALVARFIAAPAAQAVLQATATASGVTLTWPADVAGWRLQETPELSPLNWVDSQLPVHTEGGTNQVSLAAPGGIRFFRLMRP